MKQSDSESNTPIPYKYIDADNKVYKEPYINNNNEDSSEEVKSKKIEIAKSKITKKNKKINKENLSEDDINELIEEKNADIIELNKKNQKLKNKLTSLVKKVNEKITENAEILYKKDPSPTEIQWLTDQYETKKRSLQIEKKMNHSYKVQYSILENKLKNRNNNKESKDSTNIENEININKTQSIKSVKISNKNVNVSSNLYMSLEDQIKKIRNENKDLLIKINGIKSKKVSQKKEVDDIISGEYDVQFKQKNDEFQKLISLRAEATKKYNTTDRSLDMVKKKIEYFEEKLNSYRNKNDNEYDSRSQNGDNNLTSRNNDYWLNLIKQEIDNKNKEELLEIIKSGQSTIINEMKKNKKKIIKKKKVSYDMSTDMTLNNMNKNLDNENQSIDNNNNIDSSRKEKNKKINKNIYSIFSILNNMNNINNLDNKAYKNENIKNDNEQLFKLSEDQNLLNELSDLEYRELINKKEEYLETNLRLEKNIKNFSKTENSKLSKVAKSINEKINQLKIIKEKNELIQNEVNNLENIYQLSLEKEKIKQEIEKKLVINKNDDNKNIIIEDNSNVSKEEIIKNNKNNKIRNKNNDIDEVNKNSLSGTREEQLLFIKQKYMGENENESNQNIIDNENMTENNGILDNNIMENNILNNNENEKRGEGEKTGDIDYNALKLEQIPFKI